MKTWSIADVLDGLSPAEAPCTRAHAGRLLGVRVGRSCRGRAPGTGHRDDHARVWCPRSPGRKSTKATVGWRVHTSRPGSDGSDPRQRSSARSQRLPAVRARGRPSRRGREVVSSGAIIRDERRARSTCWRSVNRLPMDEPANSPPPAYSTDVARGRSDFLDLGRSGAEDHVLGERLRAEPAPDELDQASFGAAAAPASASPARARPPSCRMPMARAPSAPCVDVCESPQTTVLPGWVRPSSGPDARCPRCPSPWHGARCRTRRSWPGARRAASSPSGPSAPAGSGTA